MTSPMINSALINKSNRFHIAVGLFRNRSQMTSNVVRISVTPGCTSCATIMFLFVNKIRGMVSFKPGKDIKKDVFSSCHERGTKKKFWVPTKNRTSDLRIPGSDALPLSHRDSTVSEVYYEVHMTRFLHTARISSLIPHEGSEFFLCSTLVTGRKTSFSIYLQGSKLHHLCYSIYKHYAIDIADLGSIQYACHNNFVIDLTHRRVCGSVVEHWIAESEGLRFDSS